VTYSRNIKDGRNKKGLYSIGKKIYQDDGQMHNEGFAKDEGNIQILKARIDARLSTKQSLENKQKLWGQTSPDRHNYLN
jgi:hypothetical protein